MRAKQSSTAIGTYSITGTLTAPIPIRANANGSPPSTAIPGDPSRRRAAAEEAKTSRRSVPRLEGRGTEFREQGRPELNRRELNRRELSRREPDRRPAPHPAGVAQGEGLLHDARNLMGALSLYGDLLSRPGVLRPEHCHYAAELRLLGVRSGALMERLMRSLPEAVGGVRAGAAARSGAARAATRSGAAVELGREGRAACRPVSLREIVDRCSGLLGRVADGRTIELTYGPAACVPVMVEEEAVERILVNLVRNSAAALDERGIERRHAIEAAVPEARDSAAAPVDPARRTGQHRVRSTVRVLAPDRTSDAEESPGAVRIGVGLLHDPVGGQQPWPFQRVRLTVEDSGCGMTNEQVERLLGGRPGQPRGGRGIGFQVVRELVAASRGELRLVSARGVGTRVQIEWPAGAEALEPIDLLNVREPSAEPSAAALSGARRDSAQGGTGHVAPIRVAGQRATNGTARKSRRRGVRPGEGGGRRTA